MKRIVPEIFSALSFRILLKEVHITGSAPRFHTGQGEALENFCGATGTSEPSPVRGGMAVETAPRIRVPAVGLHATRRTSLPLRVV